MLRRRPIITPSRIARAAVGACALLVVGPFAPTPYAAAAAPATFVDLGSAASYSVLAGAGVTNTGTATVLAGDLGLSPAGAIAGFPPGTTQGVIHDKDAAAATAQEDRQAAYDAAARQTGGTPFAGDQAGAVFKPGVHTSTAAVTNTGTMTLDADGDSSAVFVFQVGAAFSSAAASKIVVTDGALANNVYWQVVGAVSFGAGAKVVGTFLGAGAISFGEGASIKGRALTPSTVGLANSPFARAKDDLTAPVVTIDGGAARSTNDPTPAIAGTTDEPAVTAVSVTVAGQSLTTTVGAGGAWSVSTSALPAGAHILTASVTDGSRNTGTAQQVLTIDVTAPQVIISGGAHRSTNDRTPAVAGTSDAPTGTTVSVDVGDQTRTATVAAGGAWSVQATALTENSHQVVASIDDVAGNTGTATQVLTVDVTVPVVAIDGGASRSTSDTSPWTYGTTAEKAGTIVNVSVGSQDLTATVHAGGTWGVSAASLRDGRYRVVASVTDAAQNTGTATQVLTIGNPGPSDPGYRYQPDAAIRVTNGSFVGVGSYAAGQRVVDQLAKHARRATFQVRLTNRGDAPDAMALLGTPRSKKFTVAYLVGTHDVTRAVTAGTYRTRSLAPGTSMLVTVKVSRTKAARVGDSRSFRVRATSSHASARRDTVVAVVRR
ncbi:ice-binding family protein [Nocardioides conyzicola]|uniref:Bacterial Ig-like domain-containing protein n=1 Tax=Nocardioides conyzicola TaxID=1651781 RepID=A0ABP8XII6_9ACTN